MSNKLLTIKSCAIMLLYIFFQIKKKVYKRKWCFEVDSWKYLLFNFKCLNYFEFWYWYWTCPRFNFAKFWEWMLLSKCPCSISMKVDGLTHVLTLIFQLIALWCLLLPHILGLVLTGVCSRPSKLVFSLCALYSMLNLM